MKAVDQLLGKPVNRKQFLAHVGAGVLAVAGVPLFIKSLHGLNAPTGKYRASGYGSSPYGGGKKH